MTDEHVSPRRQKFKVLLDPSARTYQKELEVPADQNLPGLRRELRGLYAQHPDVDGIMLRDDGLLIGIATRASADHEVGTAGEPARSMDLGSSDGATLPGLPGEFQPVVFVCRRSGCTERFLASFYDERSVPSCPTHGPAEILL